MNERNKDRIKLVIACIPILVIFAGLLYAAYSLFITSPEAFYILICAPASVIWFSASCKYIASRLDDKLYKGKDLW